MFAYVSFWSSTRLYWREHFCHLTHAVLIQPYHLMIISRAGCATPFVSKRELRLIRHLRSIIFLNRAHQVRVLQVFELLLTDLLMLLPA